MSAATASDQLIVNPGALRLLVVAIAISIGFYGVNFALSGSCLYLLRSPHRRKRFKERFPKMIWWFIYIFTMLGCATYAAADQVLSFHSTVNENVWLPQSISVAFWKDEFVPYSLYVHAAPVSLPFIILGADLFMVCTWYPSSK